VLTLKSLSYQDRATFKDRNQMNFHTRKWVKPEDLNPNGALFGGSLLRWIDEEAAIYAICQHSDCREDGVRQSQRERRAGAAWADEDLLCG
jgi:hypothetical protein